MKRVLKLKIDSKGKTYTLGQSPLYRLKTKRKLLDLLRISMPELRIAVKDDGNYVVFDQLSKSGNSRTIQHPKDGHKVIHCRIANLLSRLALPDYLHSGRKKHSHVSNAIPHVGSKKVLTTDIKQFFPSTSRIMIFNFFYNNMKCSPDVADALASICTFNGHIPTGSQLSMPLAFWANIRMFEQLNNLAVKHSVDMTVYVDDLTFSGDAVNKHSKIGKVAEMNR